MDTVIKKLLENKRVIDTRVFNTKEYSDEAYDLMDVIDLILRDARDRLFTDVDIDDVGMNSYGRVDSDRTFVYVAQLYHSKLDRKNSVLKQIPLKNKEWRSLESILLQDIKLPREDDNYEYNVSCSYEDTTLKIKLERKAPW